MGRLVLFEVHQQPGNLIFFFFQNQATYCTRSRAAVLNNNNIGKVPCVPFMEQLEFMQLLGLGQSPGLVYRLDFAFSYLMKA